MSRKKEIKTEVKAIRIKVKKYINQLDPLSLMVFPDDEYDSVLDSILSYLISNRSNIDDNMLGGEIYKYLESDIIKKDVDEVKEVAVSILSEISENLKQIDDVISDNR